MSAKAEQIIVNGAIALLGALAIGIKALDAANNWVQRKEVEKL